MNRGIARRPVFESKRDVRLFLALLARASRAGEIEIHAYSILTTHFHLLVRSPVKRLSMTIGWVEQCFVQRFNKWRDRDGPLFRGRFLSRPVEDGRYWRVLVQYIDDNPIAAGLAGHSAQYAWGSRRHYAVKRGPPWLRRDQVEAAVCRQTRATTYRPEDYDLAFPPPPAGVAWIVERRLHGSAAEDVTEVDLIRAAPARVLRGLAARARLADGGRIGVPVTTPEELGKALAADHTPGWSIRPGRKRIDGATVLRIGLLRAVCGLSVSEIHHRTRHVFPTIKRHLELHRWALRNDEMYRSKAAEATRRAVRATLLGRIK